MKSSTRFRFSLRARWTAALLAVGALPLALFAYATIRIQRAGLELAEMELEIAVIERVGEALDRQVDDAAEATHRMGRLFTDGRIAEVDTRIALARETMARAGALAHVAVYAPDGTLVDTVARVGETHLAAPPERIPPALVQTPPEEGLWLPAEFTPRGATLRYLEAVQRDGAVQAWVLGTLAPGVLADEVAEISRARFGRDDRVLVVDDARRLLAGTIQPPRPPGTPLPEREIFAGAHLPAEAFRGRFGLTTAFTAPNGEALVGTVRTLPERAWAVVVRRPEREAFAALGRSRRAFAVAAVIFAAGAAVLGTFLGARATRPIAALVGLTRAYAERRFAERSPVRTGDELEDLGHSLTSMADALARGEAEIARRARVEQDLSRYLPGEVARAVASGERSLALGGERRAVTVLFADVASFTGFAEGAAPERVVAFLNELFTVLTEVVFRHEGMVDKFIGDCVMAVFGAAGGSDHAPRALAAAEDMHRFVEASAPGWRETYGIDVAIGIGVHTGEGLVGNLGSEARMEYTVIGDVVNVAARLETLARPGVTLVTAAVARAGGEGFAFEPLGTHPLRGKREAVEIFEVRA